MKKLTLVLVVALLAGLAFVASAQGPTKQQELDAKGITNWTPGQSKGQGPAFSRLANGIQAKGNPGVIEIGGTETTQYDSGSVTALPAAFGQIFGNQWNVDNNGNPYKATVTLNSFSFLFAEDSITDTGLFFQAGSAVGASTLFARASVNITGLANSGPSFTTPVFNNINQTVLGTSGVFSNSFYLGAWCLQSTNTLPATNEVIGLDVATFNGGFQGYTATSGATTNVGFAAQSFNAILRANVTGVVPVELMAFDVE